MNSFMFYNRSDLHDWYKELCVGPALLPEAREEAEDAAQGQNEAAGHARVPHVGQLVDVWNENRGLC